MQRPLTSRRTLLVGAVSLAVAGPAGAQTRTYHMGYLAPGDGAGPSPAALFAALEEVGYRKGQNLVVQQRFADGRLDRLPSMATELVLLKPDILVSTGTQATLAASKATTTIPTVFVAVTDPVGQGIVKSLRQPGTNATGLSNQADEAQIKLLQLVKEVFPEASDVAILYNPLNAPEVRTLSVLQKAGSTLALNVRTIEARTPEDFAPAFKKLKGRRADVLYVMAGPLADMQRDRRGVGERSAPADGVRQWRLR